MSSIEQAARRLEELRRAGADVAPVTARDDNAVPTPEALVRTLQLREADRAAQTPVPPQGESHEHREERRVELDLIKLRSMGFVTPESGATKIAGQFAMSAESMAVIKMTEMSGCLDERRHRVSM